ncbi:hypothetical protein CPB86DRAFT_778251 [Serendipita vermifera]|nr:hypothetical protein CPB86DRAFT_778251 [Serendipita vermifera]
MPSPAFDKLPPELIIVISANLDLGDLVSLAQVNQDFRQLSKSSKSFWLHSIIRQRAHLPLATHRPLESFTVEELRCGCHRAVIRDRELSMDEVKLQSCTKISWPYLRHEAEAGEHLDFVDPEQAADMFNIHPNGEWIFLFSTTHVMRVFHVRTRKMVWSSPLGGAHWLVDNNGEDPLPSPFINFMGDSKAMMVNVYVHEMTNYEWMKLTGSGPTVKSPKWLLQLRLWEVSFCSQTLSVKMKEATSRAMASPPSQFDLAGDYVLVVEGGAIAPNSHGVVGRIRLFDWKVHKKAQESKPHFIEGFESALEQQALESINGAMSNTASDFVQSSTLWISLPEQLLPTIVVSLFPDYLISIGACCKGHVHLQVLAFPLESEMEKSTASEQPSSGFVLAADIFLCDSYPSNHGWEPRICHKYIGRHQNRITIWIPEEQPLPMWHIYDFDVDFRKPPHQWFSQTTNRDSRLDGKSMVSKRTIYDTTSAHWALPLLDGKRFFSVDHIEVGGNNPVLLSLFHLDSIPLMEEPPSFESELDAEAYYLKQLGQYSKRVFDSPIHYFVDDLDPVSIIGFDFLEWSGIAVLFMSNGDIWVLRYGHA